MKTWAFKTQTDATRLRDSLLPDGGKVSEPPDFLSSRGLVCLTPPQGIPARSGSICGKAECQIFTIDEDDDELIAFETHAESSLLTEVLNIEAAAVPGGKYVTVVDIFGRPVVFLGGEGEPPEPNPGVVTVEITSESSCFGETFEELGHHVFLATILSRPFGSPTEMRRERSGELTIFDPTGCMLDLAYGPEEFIGATAFVSLMYGGEIFDQQYNFKGGSGAGDDDVLTTDTYETFRPTDSCKPFGWVGGERTGYTASIGAVIPNGNTTFQVQLPERGLYEVEITYGDESDPTKNLVTLLDGDIELATFTGESEEGETWVVKDEYIFRSTNRPLLKINLNNADAYDTRIVKLVIKQLDPPTQWEVVNRCCIDADTAEG